MYTIIENSLSELEIKKSKFITLLYKINSVKQVSSYLNEVKTLYSGATHYCYAYIIDEVYHFSDDGEPGGTAGLPMLDILKKNSLNHVLCIVIRYFGGIKLGAGGLVRAYAKAVREAIQSNQLVALVNGYLVEIVIDYDKIKKLDYLLQNYQVVEKEFNETIVYKVKVPENDYEVLSEYSPTILENIVIEKSI